MATTRINAVSATATTFAGDDFLPIDGNVNATRRLLLTSLFASPSAIGSVTPAAGTFTSLSGTNINGTLGSTTPSTIAGTTISATGIISSTSNNPSAEFGKGNGTAASVRLNPHTASHYNWSIDNGVTSSGTLNIAPSTAVGGNTYTTPVAIFTTTGLNSTAIGATTASTGAFTTLSATGQITSTVASGTATLESTAPYGTGYKAIRLGNTGSTLTVGVESSAGGSLLTSATGYAGVVSSNSTILQLGASNTIVATLSSGALAVTGTLSSSAAAAAFTGLQVGTSNGANSGLIIGNKSSGTGAMWSTSITPSATNYAFHSDGGQVAINAATTATLNVANSVIASASSTGLAVTGALSATSLALNGYGNLAIDLSSSSAASSLIKYKGSTGDTWQAGAGMLNAGDWGVSNVTRSVNPIVITGGTTSPTTTFYNNAGAQVGQFSSTGLAVTGVVTASVAKMGTGFAGFAEFSDSTRFGAAGTYSFLSETGGTSTYVNASTGGNVYLRIANADKAVVSSTGLAVTGALSVSTDVGWTNGSIARSFANTSVANASSTITGVNSTLLIVRNNTQGGTGIINVDPVGGVAIISDPNAQFSITDGGGGSNKIVVTVSGTTISLLNRWGTTQVVRGLALAGI